MNAVNVVSFYAPRPDHERHTHDYLLCLALQRQSCARFGCRQIVITDDAPSLADFPTFNTILPHSLMRAIIAGQLAYLESAAFDADTLLTGADCLLGRDPRAVFDGGFDVAVTTHGGFSDCIMNTGAIFVPVASRELAAPFWRRALATMGDAWGDDQLALAREFDATLKHGTEMRGAARIKFLPCEGINWAPDNENDGIDSLVVHFRGPRKRWMEAWAERFAR